jgi:hypothetical protein
MLIDLAHNVGYRLRQLREALGQTIRGAQPTGVPEDVRE